MKDIFLIVVTVVLAISGWAYVKFYPQNITPIIQESLIKTAGSSQDAKKEAIRWIRSHQTASVYDVEKESEKICDMNATAFVKASENKKEE